MRIAWAFPFSPMSDTKPVSWCNLFGGRSGSLRYSFRQSRPPRPEKDLRKGIEEGDRSFRVKLHDRAARVGERSCADPELALLHRIKKPDFSVISSQTRIWPREGSFWSRAWTMRLHWTTLPSLFFAWVVACPHPCSSITIVGHSRDAWSKASRLAKKADAFFPTTTRQLQGGRVRRSWCCLPSR